MFRPVRNRVDGNLEKPLSPAALYHCVIRKYAAETGLDEPGFCIHSLRATAATNALEHEADIAAIDRVLVNVLGFTGDIDALTRDFRREALFQRNELRRMVCEALREANGPLTVRQITERVIARKGLTMRPGKQSKQWINRVRKICQKLPLEAVRADGCQAWRR